MAQRKLTDSQKSLFNAITQELRRETALAYIDGGCANQTRAYLTACEKMGKEPSKNPETSASEILHYPNVVDFISSITIEAAQEVKQKHNVTVESLIIELEEARDVAKIEGQSSALVSASMAKAKLCGLDKQIVETTIKVQDDGSNGW